ncbi:MAG TPA: ABC transporter permease [Dongiaceae bacterium]|nr:ABC transporter permease [Dongiaceae bacterium]
MKPARVAATVVVVIIGLLCVAESLLPRFDYTAQDRLECSSRPTGKHWLGTDALGRDRFARLLHGTRVSLSMAPAAAAVSLCLAFLFGAVPGYVGGLSERAAKAMIDLMLAMPWLFLLLIARAALPLNTSPQMSVAVTFLMLGLLGWGVPARVLLAQSRRLRESEFLLLACATGVSRSRLLVRQVLPNLLPVMWTQFWIAIPMFVLAEANLSMLGLGVAEPVPSLGSLLKEIESAMAIQSYACSFSALFVLVVFVGSVQIAFMRKEVG